MSPISAQQIRAARAWMNWTRDTLAEESGISKATIRNLEEGKVSSRSVDTVRLVFENKGFKFHGKEGLSHQSTDARTYQGLEGCNNFFEDLLKTIKKHDGNVGAIFTSYEQLNRCLDLASPTSFDRLEQLAKLAKVQCLLADVSQSPPALASFEFRATQQHPLYPLGQVIYGNKMALIIPVGKEFVYQVMRGIETVQASWKVFQPHWDKAFPAHTLENR